MRFLWLLALAGCGPCFYQQLVHVTDEEGKPIEGAGVTVVGPSVSGPTQATNAAGLAPVSTGGAWSARWISVRAPGFASLQADLPAKWPLELSLRREAKVGDVYELIATIGRRGMLSALEAGSVLLPTTGVDLRWFVELSVRKRVSGPCPAREGEILRYAVHSPSLFLQGLESGDIRIRGTIFDLRGKTVHGVRLLPP